MANWAFSELGKKMLSILHASRSRPGVHFVFSYFPYPPVYACHCWTFYRFPFCMVYRLAFLSDLTYRLGSWGAYTFLLHLGASGMRVSFGVSFSFETGESLGWDWNGVWVFFQSFSLSCQFSLKLNQKSIYVYLIPLVHHRHYHRITYNGIYESRPPLDDKIVGSVFVEKKKKKAFSFAWHCASVTLGDLGPFFIVLLLFLLIIIIIIVCCFSTRDGLFTTCFLLFCWLYFWAF